MKKSLVPIVITAIVAASIVLFASWAHDAELKTIIYKTGESPGFTLDTLIDNETDNFDLPRTLLGRFDYGPVEYQVKLTNIADTNSVTIYLQETLDASLIGWTNTDTIVSAKSMLGGATQTYLFSSPVNADNATRGTSQRLQFVSTGTGGAKTSVKIAAKVRYPKG